MMGTNGRDLGDRKKSRGWPDEGNAILSKRAPMTAIGASEVDIPHAR
jgi:hypothetical protein